MKKKLSIIVPVYNNQDTLDELYSRIVKAIKKNDFDYSIIFVNDSSIDESFSIIKKICLIDKKAICLNLDDNYGQLLALNSGLHYCDGDYVMNLDADLQDPPEIIDDILKEMKDEPDVVIAARKSVEESLFRKITSTTHFYFMRRSLKDYPKKGANLICMSKKIVDNIKKDIDSTFYFVPDILSKNYKKKFVYYDRLARLNSKTQSSFIDRLKESFENFTIFSVWPFKSLFFIGTVMMIMSILYIIMIVISYFNNETPFIGYSPIIILILLFGGINIFVLGVISEYLKIILKKLSQDKRSRVKDTINV